MNAIYRLFIIHYVNKKENLMCGTPALQSLSISTALKLSVPYHICIEKDEKGYRLHFSHSGPNAVHCKKHNIICTMQSNLLYKLIFSIFCLQVSLIPLYANMHTVPSF